MAEFEPGRTGGAENQEFTDFPDLLQRDILKAHSGGVEAGLQIEQEAGGRPADFAREGEGTARLQLLLPSRREEGGQRFGLRRAADLQVEDRFPLTREGNIPLPFALAAQEGGLGAVDRQSALCPGAVALRILHQADPLEGKATAPEMAVDAAEVQPGRRCPARDPLP